MISTDPENVTFQLAADFINKSNLPVFLTGKAGTGKTTFLKFIRENSLKSSAIVAPTGVAAMNAGGTTIHSFFQLPFTPFIPATKDHFSKSEGNDTHSLLSHLRLTTERKEILQSLELLIIDEISMVRADVLDSIDTVLRYVRSNQKPFGGVQVLFIGDMYQLPPVAKNEEWQLLSKVYDAPFFFCSHVIKQQPPVYIELEKVYRQKDQQFISLLNQIRNNELAQEGYELLHSRMTEQENSADEQVITLTTHNAKADAINEKMLSELPGSEQTFKATVEGTFFESAFPAEEHLRLKVGAQVMFLKNDTEKVRRYYNGKIGIVSKIEHDKVHVEISAPEKQTIELKKDLWRNIKYTLNKRSGRVDEEELGTFSQFPLRLAWAITIHKSQGLTFEKVVIDAGEAFSPGQVYVALSRCTSIDGIRLLSKISHASLRTDPRIVAFAQEQKNVGQRAEMLEEATEQYAFEQLRSVFDYSLLISELSEYNTWLKKNFGLREQDWLSNMMRDCDALAEPANKFLRQIDQLHENKDDSLLSDRIKAAVSYFLPRMQSVAESMKRSPIVSDNRQLANENDARSQALFDLINTAIHNLQGCSNGFNLETFIQHRTNYKRQLLTQKSYSGRSSFIPGDIPHPALYDKLRSKRDEICGTKNLPVYMVCSSVAIEQMSYNLPLSLHQLEKISGFGKVKLKQYGKQFLDIIAEYCSENDIDGNRNAAPEKKIRKPRTDKTDTKVISYDLYKTGKPISEIAKERSLTASTIEGHLAHYVSTGEIPLEELVGRDKIEQIQKAVGTTGVESITVLKQKLPEISYGELRLYLASQKQEAE